VPKHRRSSNDKDYLDLQNGQHGTILKMFVLSASTYM
jgi:hypothetical protein